MSNTYEPAYIETSEWGAEIAIDPGFEGWAGEEGRYNTTNDCVELDADYCYAWGEYGGERIVAVWRSAGGDPRFARYDWVGTWIINHDMESPFIEDCDGIAVAGGVY